MKKISLFLLLLLITNCDNGYKKEIELIDLVPTNPILLVKYNSTKEIDAEVFHKNFNSLLNYQSDSISKKFLNKPVLISYHSIGKDEIQSIIYSEQKNVVKNFNILDSVIYNGFTIKRIVDEKNEYYNTIKNGIYIESKNKLLVENSLRNSNHIYTEKSGDLKKLYNISNSNISLFISNNFSKYLKNSNLKELFKTSNVSDWIQFDIELNPNKLILNGIGFQHDSILKKINILKDISPSQSNINKIIPSNFKQFKRIAYNHSKIISNLENKISINELKKVINDSLFYDINEIGKIFFENDTISTLSFKSNKLLERLIQNNLKADYIYRNNKIHEFNNKLFKTKIPFRDFEISKKNYGTLIENILILSNNKNSIENIILNFRNNSTVIKSSRFNKDYDNIPQKSNLLNIYNLSQFDTILFKDFNLKQENYRFWINHLSIEENIIYKTHSIAKSEKEINSLGPKILFNLKLNDGIFLKPKWMTNYVTKKKELLTQDNKNNLYLISSLGEIIWKKDLKSKIIGEITQIDLYKNGRLQYAFNTEKSFIILDKNGKEVKKIDHKKNSKVLGLSVFDYDKNKNYRFLICYENQIKMLDSKMKIVRGFNKNNIKYKITNSPKHFRIGSKDYLIINTEKKLYITDRRGNIRIKVPQNLNVSGNEIYINKNSILTIDNNNNLIRISLNGKISKNPLPLESKYSITSNNKNTAYMSENILNINNKNIEIKYGNYSKPKLFNNKFISITNFDESKVYLFDTNGDAIDHFPIFGNSIIDVTINNEKNKLITVCGDENEIITYSFD